MIRYIIIALFAAPMPLSESKPDQFDLLCSGQVESLPYLSGEIKVSAFSDRLRVDLKTMRYCVDVCEATYPIKEVTEVYIAFESTNTQHDARLPTQNHGVSRTDGSYSVGIFHANGDGFYTKSGKCTVAGFTGFPVQPTKF